MTIKHPAILTGEKKDVQSEAEQKHVTKTLSDPSVISVFSPSYRIRMHCSAPLCMIKSMSMLKIPIRRSALQETGRFTYSTEKEKKNKVCETLDTSLKIFEISNNTLVEVFLPLTSVIRTLFIH